MINILFETEDHSKIIAQQSLIWLQEGGFL